MKLYKCRTKHASGNGKWYLMELPEGYKSMREYFENNDEYSWSDKFRGWEWVRVKNIPADYIAARIKRLKDSIKYSREEIRRLERVETVEVKRTCRNCGYGPKCSTLMKEDCKKKKWYSCNEL